jgi:hypothetical protein
MEKIGKIMVTAKLITEKLMQDNLRKHVWSIFMCKMRQGQVLLEILSNDCLEGA